MGDGASLSRVERFMKEFGEELKAHLLKDNPKILLMNQGFNADINNYLRLYVELDINGEGYELCADDVVFFDPEEPFEDMVERMGELYGMTEEEATERLRKVLEP